MMVTLSNGNLFKEPLGELGILSVLDIILILVKKARDSIEW